MSVLCSSLLSLLVLWQSGVARSLDDYEYLQKALPQQFEMCYNLTDSMRAVQRELKQAVASMLLEFKQLIQPGSAFLFYLSH